VKHQKGKMEAHGGTRNLPYSTLVNYGAKLWDWCLCGDFNWNILGDCAKGFVYFRTGTLGTKAGKGPNECKCEAFCLRLVCQMCQRC
jgi:hypothetical protein